MFEKVLKELEKLQNEQISIPIAVDNEGYWDRECPNTDCEFQFKIHQDDWRDICRDEQIFCPLCRHEAESDAWWTQEQLANATEQGLAHLAGRIDHAFAKSAKNFNSSQSRNSFLQIKMKISSPRPYHIILPIPSSEEMVLKVTCEVCHTRYSVVGSAFFCPSCGHNSAGETFDSSVKKIEDKIKNLPLIHKAVATVSKDEAETTCRSLIETGLNEGVVAFQRFCEVTYTKALPGQKVKFNAFQNLDTGSDYWKILLGEGYTDWITKSDFNKLNILFQRRHLLSHTEGIVDQKYVDRSGDLSYKAGQRLVIKEADVYDLTRIIKTIATTIRLKIS
ncbi:hypothetical protein [Pedobacter sp. UC225_65]|uniref:hypothetical protein n=1 Tax=Pedobacter sp. UC225_65 TaxID=3350173 RepID=UPI00366D8E96